MFACTCDLLPMPPPTGTAGQRVRVCTCGHLGACVCTRMCVCVPVRVGVRGRLCVHWSFLLFLLHYYFINELLAVVSLTIYSVFCKIFACKYLLKTTENKHRRQTTGEATVALEESHPVTRKWEPRLSGFRPPFRRGLRRVIAPRLAGAATGYRCGPETRTRMRGEHGQTAATGADGAAIRSAVPQPRAQPSVRRPAGPGPPELLPPCQLASCYALPGGREGQRHWEEGHRCWEEG